MVVYLKPSKKVIESKNRKMLASFFGNTASIYSSCNYKEKAKIVLPSAIADMCFSHNSKMLALKTYTGHIFVYLLSPLQKIASFSCVDKKESQIFGMCFSKDNKSLVDLVYADNGLSYVNVYNLQTGKEALYFQGRNFVFKTIEYVEEKDTYFVTGYEKLSLQKKNRFFYMYLSLEEEQMKKIPLKRNVIKTVQGEKDTKTYSVGIGKDANKVFRYNSRIYSIYGVVTDIAVNKEGTKLLVVNNNIIALFATDKYAMLKKFAMEDINYTAFSEDGNKIYMCSDKETCIYSLED